MDRYIPPDEFPRLSQRVATTITNVDSGSNAPLSSYEAVGVSILLQEAAALAQAFAVNDKVANQLNDILGNVDRGLSQGDIIEGFIGFLVQIKNVAGIRKLIQSGFDMTPRPDIGHIIKVRRIEEYMSELDLDKYTFGEHVLSKIVDVVKNGMNNELDSSQRNDPKTVALVYNSREKGANMARDLFVEATNLAVTHL